MKMSIKLVMVTAILLMAGCLSGHRTIETEANAQVLASLMVGTYQVSADGTENGFIDTRIPMRPLSAGEWLYYQINTGSELSLYRQRIIRLQDSADGEVVQNTWNLKNPQDYTNVLEIPQRLNDLTMEDLVENLGPGCEQRWRYIEEDSSNYWLGLVNPETCKVFSERRQATISIKAEARLSDKSFWQKEQGFDKNGKQLFGNDQGEFIILHRVP